MFGNVIIITDIVMETLLTNCLPRVEKETDLKLWTYLYHMLQSL